MRKGIILAGGRGTRLHPVTKAVNKHLLPVYDKPMIYYPLTTLMLAGIKEIALITTNDAIGTFGKLLGNGGPWGINITYLCQKEPRGIPDAFLVAEKFIGKDDVALILGDNLFYGNEITELLYSAVMYNHTTIFSYHVNNPEDYGVVKYNDNGSIFGFIEKPPIPNPTYRAVPGIYFYPNSVVEIAKALNPSSRGELEVMDINREYLDRGEIVVCSLGRGIAWFDCGTFENLLAASQFVQIVQERQGVKIGDPDEVARMMM